MKIQFNFLLTAFIFLFFASCGNGDFMSKQEQDALSGLNKKQEDSLFAHLNWINGVPVVDGENTAAGEFIELEGWAIDPIAGSIASGVYISIGNKIYTTEYGRVRDDVATYFEDIKFKESGFLARVPMSALSAGLYPIEINVVSADGTSYYTSSAVKSIKLRL